MSPQFVQQLSFFNLIPLAARYSLKAWRPNLVISFHVGLLVLPMFWFIAFSGPADVSRFFLAVLCADALRSLLMDPLMLYSFTVAESGQRVAVFQLWRKLAEQILGKLLVLLLPFLLVYVLSFFFLIPLVDSVVLLFIFAPIFLALDPDQNPWQAIKKSAALVIKKLGTVLFFHFLITVLFIVCFYFFYLFLSLTNLVSLDVTMVEQPTAELANQQMQQFLFESDFFWLFQVYTFLLQPIRSLAAVFLFFYLSKTNAATNEQV